MTRHPSSPKGPERDDIEALLAENKELRSRLRELKETLDAIRSGEVDAIIVNRDDARQIYTLEGSDHPYRVLIENIQEGALTLSKEGEILYGNERFAAMVHTPLSAVIGSDLSGFVCPHDRHHVAELLENALFGPARSRLNLCHPGGIIPVIITLNLLVMNGNPRISAIISDRKEDEDRIRLQSLMLDATGDAVIASDVNGKIIYWNEAAARTYGWRPEEIIGQDLIEVIIPDLRMAEAREIALRIIKGETRTGTCIVKHRDGHEFPVHACDAPVFDGGGNLIAIIGASHDISEQKKAEEALKKSEEEYRQLVEYAPASICEIDLMGHRFLRVNDTMCQILGYTRKELLEMDPFDILDKESRNTFRDLIREKGSGERINESGGYRVVTKDKKILWLTLNIKQNYSDRKGILVVAHDITVRKLAEAALRESEERAIARSDELALVMDSVPAAVWIAHDSEGRHITGNAQSYEWLGIPYGSEASKSAPEGERPETFRLFKDGRELLPCEMPVQKAAGGIELRNFEFDLVYPDGTVRNVLGNASPLFDHDGNPRGSVSSFIDITSRKRSENALRKSEAELKEALAEKEILLAEIHHRVKNNLTAFISLLSLDGVMEESNAGKALKKDLQNRARSMALIHDTLYRTGKFSNVDMNVYLTTLMSQIAGSYAEKAGIHIEVRADGIAIDLARATASGLIINELVTNSFKYAFPPEFDCRMERGESCVIRIGMVGDGDFYIITVADNGRGLPPGLDIQTTKSLGLKLVKFLAMHQLQAQISIRTDKGTEFTFRLKKKVEFA